MSSPIQRDPKAIAGVTKKKALGQYPTPPWAPELFVARFFPHLSVKDCVYEPSCGPGAFLLAIPPEIRAYGIEIDPEQAELARQYTGRTIIVGDFRTVKLPEQPTVIIGNPPFEAKVIDGFLTRAHQVLPRNGEVGFIQPAYFWQTASRIVTYNEYWSLEVTMIPRNLYEGLSEPLVFAIYRKDNLRKLIGLAFYHETYEVQQLPDKYREVLTNGKGPIWKTTVTIALGELGGEADLEQIYGEVSEHRPTENPFWKEKIRQVLGTQPEFAWVREGRYRFATEKEAA